MCFYYRGVSSVHFKSESYHFKIFILTRFYHFQHEFITTFCALVPFLFCFCCFAPGPPDSHCWCILEARQQSACCFSAGTLEGAAVYRLICKKRTFPYLLIGLTAMSKIKCIYYVNLSYIFKSIALMYFWLTLEWSIKWYQSACVADNGLCDLRLAALYLDNLNLTWH